MKSKIIKYIHVLCIFTIAVLFVVAFYFKSFYSLSHFEEIIYSIKDGTNSADTTFLTIGFKTCLPYIIVVFTFLYLILFKKSHNKIINKIQDRKVLITWGLFILVIMTVLWSTSFYPFLYYSNKKSLLIKDNYVDPKKTDIKFNEKRNLIFITVESLETSLFKKDNNGYWDYDVIPELYDLLNDSDSVVFYNNNISEQLNMIQGSSWTTASVIANSSGLPFKVSNSSLKSGNLLEGAYTLGDLLRDNGYINEVISAASSSYGDLNKYFKKHGNYSVIDIDTLSDYGFKMTDNDIGRWGFNDNYLFEIAKQRLDILSKSDQPFNLQLLTIDTHFIDGYVGDYSINKYDSQYENAYATESKLIYDFITWLKEQPYYKNTTIVVMGDHLSMQSEFFRKRHAKKRYVYSCIINPINKNADNQNRVVTALDTYPTVVSALGGEITGNKLGLGVNLFSNEMTLAEKYGINILDNELKKKSVFYQNTINY